MKNFGFTLAEVLITLGIIGVVAALTLPNITANTKAAQIGPKLGKAVSTFEQANEAFLAANSVDALSDLDRDTDSQYVEALSDYLKGNVSGATITTKDNTRYIVETHDVGNPTKAPHKLFIGTVNIDINPSNGEEIPGEDYFTFGLFNDGSLKPKGVTNWNGEAAFDGNLWSDDGKCPVDKIPEDPSYCAGHIFENNMKVLYVLK